MAFSKKPTPSNLPEPKPPRPERQPTGAVPDREGFAEQDPGSGDEKPRIQEARAAGFRAESSLSALVRAVEEVSAGLADARQANDALIAEFRRVSDQVHQGEQARLELNQALVQLAAQCDEAQRQRDEAQRQLVCCEEQREQLFDEHDGFLASLLEEHEEELEALRREYESCVQSERVAAEKAARDEAERQLQSARQEHEAALQRLRIELEKQMESERLDMERRLPQHSQRGEEPRADDVERGTLACGERGEARGRSEQEAPSVDAGRASADRLPATPPGPELPEDVGYIERLEQELADARTQLETLARERERSREMLRRLQSQRDEAHRTVNELRRSHSPMSRSDPAGRRSGAAQAAPRAANREAEPTSELAAALAASDPRKRRCGSSVPGFQAIALQQHPSLEGKSEAVPRSSGGYSASDVAPNHAPPRSSRRS